MLEPIQNAEKDPELIPHLSTPVDIEIQRDTTIPDPHTPTTKHPRGKRARLIHALLWTPPWCRWDEQNPPKFGLPLNFLFAFAGTFTV
jgi:hypothetical protein